MIDRSKFGCRVDAELIKANGLPEESPSEKERLVSFRRPGGQITIQFLRIEPKSDPIKGEK